MVYLGIDIGGTGVKAALVNDQGQILHHAETPTRAFEGAAALLGRVETLATSMLRSAKTPVSSCGVGSPGRIDVRRGHVLFASANLPGWTGTPLGPELSRRLGLPTVVDNDVNVAALAEGWVGAGRGAANFLMLTLGTGVGGAVIIDSQLWRGAQFGAGEVGHMALYPGGQPCNCGGTGCAEQYVSAKALTRGANEFLREGRPFRGIREVLSTAAKSPAPRRDAARQSVERFTGDLALFLSNLQQAFDPQVIIIGGGIVRLGFWWDRLLEAVARETRSRSLTVRLKKAHCGPQAGVIGAARLAMLGISRNNRGHLAPLGSASGEDGSLLHPHLF
ncbi:MAG: ROK family protein [Mycobacterium leprae]